MAGRKENRSKLVPMRIKVPAQTHAYLVKFAERGALAQNETTIATQIIVNEVERLIERGRADKEI